MTCCYAGKRIEFTGEAVGRFKRSNKRGDITVSGSGLTTVIIEGEYSDVPNCNPDKDALSKMSVFDEAMNQKIGTTIAVCYPKGARSWNIDDVQQELLQGARLQYATFIQEKDSETIIRFPEKGYITGDIWSLTDLAVILTNPYHKIVEIAEDTSIALRSAMQNLQDALCLEPNIEQQLAVAIGRPGGLDSFSIISMIWLNAFLFQDRIAEFYNKEVPLRAKLRDYQKVIPSRTYDAWQSILKINYQSIYKPASDVLGILLNNVNTQAIADVLTSIADTAEKIDTESLGLFDIGGELFQGVISDRDNAASYYTKPAIAEFLARIVAHKMLSVDLRAENYSNYRELRIGDFACGTGTLLRAMYRRLASLTQQEEFTSEQISKLHRYMMEEGFCGIDISPIAAHLTASSLSNAMPQTKYRNTNIGVISVGGKEGRTGSIEFLQESQQPDLLKGDHRQGSLFSESIGVDGSRLSVLNDSFDVIIMNPPYQRARGQQKQFDVAGVTEKDRKLAIERCRSICSKIPSINLQAGLGNVFCELAMRSLNTGGRLGIILPMTAAQAQSWGKMRSFLERNFDDLTVISFSQGSKGGEHSLSADTHMGEIMITGTRRRELRGKDEQHTITFVVINNQLADIKDAIEIARSINATLDGRGARKEGHIRLGDSNYGYWMIAPVQYGQPWSYVGIQNFNLITLARHLVAVNELIPLGSSNKLCTIPMTTIGHVLDVGSTHDLIGHPVGGDQRGQYEMHKIDNQDIHKIVSLWAAYSEKQAQILVDPTHYGLSMNPDDVDKVQAVQSSASNLFYQRNVRWTSQKILVAKTNKPVLGGRAWTSLRNNNPKYRDDVVEFAFSLFANSILGILVHWSYTQRQQAGRSLVQVKAIKTLPCINIHDERIYNKAERLMKKHQGLLNKKLDRLQFAFKDATRQRIDDCVAELLDIPLDSKGHCQILRDLAKSWCDEPSVRGA